MTGGVEMKIRHLICANPKCRNKFEIVGQGRKLYCSIACQQKIATAKYRANKYPYKSFKYTQGCTGLFKALSIEEQREFLEDARKRIMEDVKFNDVIEALEKFNKPKKSKNDMEL